MEEWEVNWVKASAPELVSLQVEKEGRDGELGPVDLFGGNTPKLSELRLKSVAIPWDTPMLADLTGLSLTSIDQNGPSGAAIIAI